MSTTYEPLTIISPSTEVSMDEMAKRVEETREKHGQILQDYHKVWYESGHTWVFTQYMGIGVMKSWNDLGAYQDLMYWHRPTLVIETGTYQGASALWIAHLMDQLRIDGGRVFSVDIEDRRQCEHPRITFLAGSSVDPVLVDALKAEVRPDDRVLIILDSDHSESHVRNELEAYAPFCRLGDWLVVEDTNIEWEGDRGARGGLEDYLRAHEGEFRQDLICERFLLTCNPGGWLQRVGVRG